ncbi:cell cycle progression protein 1 isoform X2 [Pogona vitticeps]
MAENSSDSDSSSCGWTVINHEGSDIEALASEYEGAGGPMELDTEDMPSPPPENVLQDQLVDMEAESDQVDVSPVAEEGCCAPETLQTVPEEEKGKLPGEGSGVGAASDDSDIVTLEAPKVEEVGSHEEGLVPVGEEAHLSEDFNMGSSSSSQYTFCQPETATWWEKLWKRPGCVSGWVFPPHPRTEDSSSDENGICSSPALRRRRAKKRALSNSESEDMPPLEQEMGHGEDQQRKPLFSSGLNRCIILALVIAVSMGFGHFYGLLEGTVQIQKRQQLVKKTHEDKLNDMKGDLMQCQQEQGRQTECSSLKEGLAACLLTTEMEKKSFESQKHRLASENLHLRESLEKEEKALTLLQEELRKLREEIRQLENKGPGPESPVLSENQKLKAYLEEEKHRAQSFVKQKETLLAEAQMLRRELDKERQLTVTLREELDKLSSQQAMPGAGDGFQESPEIEVLRERLTELEKKLSFEQQRSDLWEKLYVEVKDHAEKQERVDKAQKPAGKGNSRAKKKTRANFFGSVKETLDAMKNSTKEFVKHHKEKIKRAKEAVKENLKKFSDSVKSTFRHFKDTTRNIFEDREKKRYGGDKGYEAKKKGKAASPAGASHEEGPHGSPRGFRDARRPRDSPPPECRQGPTCSQRQPAVLKGCTGIFDCAHQEFVSLFNKVLDPIRADEFNQLMHKYLQQQVNNFHHWRELEIFVNRFFRNGVFIHDQMLFTDFVNDIKDYLEDLKEYQRSSSSSSGSGAFEDLDKYIYHYYFHYDPSPQHRSSHPVRKAPFAHPQRPQQERPVLKHQQRYKREGRWHREGRANGRHMASLEIEVGQMPFDPKY